MSAEPARLHMLIHMQDAAMDTMQNSTSKGGHMMRRITLISSSGQALLSFRVTMKKSQAVLVFSEKKPRLHPDPGGITCFTGQPAVQQRFPFVPFPSLRLRHRQRPDAEHGRRTISAPARVNASGRRTAATSPSEYKLALIPKGVELKGESLKLPC